MSASSSPLGYGLYFIDVLACSLFCLTLALVSARFSREVTVPLELPSLASAAGPSVERTAPTLRMDTSQGESLHFEGERVSRRQLEDRLKGSRADSLVIETDAPLSEIIALARDAGVRNVQIAYRAKGKAK